MVIANLSDFDPPRGVLWTHTAYTGHLRTTTMLNWAYNQAVFRGRSSFIFSLEVPSAQCRRLLTAMHSAHPKFALLHPPLDYDAIRDDKLDADAEGFMRDVVEPDLADYGNIHVEVPDPDETHVTMRTIAERAERAYEKNPFTTLFVDQAGLVSGNVFPDAKQVATGFRGGAGVAVVMLHTVSREAFRVASRVRSRTGTDAMYALEDVGWEGASHSDIVTASWVDEDLQAEGRVVYQNLKNRFEREVFAPFKAQVHWPSRRLI